MFFGDYFDVLFYKVDFCDERFELIDGILYIILSMYCCSVSRLLFLKRR